MKNKLFFFGVDSATWELIKPWVKKGKLPGFAKLLSRGSCFDLTSTMPPLTPVAWPTALTGASPWQHGFYDFYKLDKDKQITINTAEDLKYPFFWEILGKMNKKVGIFNLPITYPFNPVNGIMISGLMTPSTKANFVYPEKLKPEFLKLFPSFRFGPHIKVSKLDPTSYDLRLKENIKDAKETIKIAKWLFEKANWDMFAINFMAVDHVQHFYWEFMNDKKSKYQNAVLGVYQIIDKYLLEVLTKYSPKYQIMVFSDHGAGSLEKTVFLNHWLLKKGYLKFKQTPQVWLKRVLSFLGFNPQEITRLASKLRFINKAGKIETQTRTRWLNKLILSYADLDWTKTKAYSFGMYGGIFLTKKNKNLSAKIIKELKQDFASTLTFVDSSSNIYQTQKYPSTIPDIQFLLKKGAIVSTNIYAFSGNKLFTPPITNKSGEHRVNGILGLYPKVKINKSDPNLLDIAPTILDFFKASIPDYITGSSLIKKNNELEIKDIVV